MDKQTSQKRDAALAEWHQQRFRKANPHALVTDLQRLDSRLTAASRRLKEANDELHRAEIEHRQASEAVEVELARSGGTVDAT